MDDVSTIEPRLIVLVDDVKSETQKSDLSSLLLHGSSNQAQQTIQEEILQQRSMSRSKFCVCFIGIARFCCFTIPIFLVIGIRLLLYVIVLIPLFIRFIYYYAFSSHQKVVRYGSDSIRQSMDIFEPAVVSNTTPIVFFVCGGAWIIGYKMWGALLARVLTNVGVTVILPDYRNYPWGVVPEAVQDIQLALRYVSTTFEQRPIVAVGQSAGSHLLVTIILQHALSLSCQENNTEMDDCDNNNRNEMSTTITTNWLRNVRGVIALSGPLDLDAMGNTFRKCGMDEDFVDRIFGGQRDDYDPMLLLDRLAGTQDSARRHQALPPLRIYHGTADTTVPVQVARDFVEKYPAHLDQVKYYENWSHTDPILEGIADADHRFHLDVLDAIQLWTNAPNLQWPNHNDPILKRLAPHCLVQLARFFMPF
jgi:fermentation-respiration switch protein FrsA (DUF1100 family)